MEDLLFIGLALVLLFVGAEGLVRGSASLALRAGLSPLVIGLTIVAFGTSSPELVVSVKSALSEQGDIAVGNVVGSNAFNIGVILALTALVFPISVQRQIIRIDGPIAAGVAVLLPLLLLDQRVGRIEGLLLLAGLAAYTFMNLRIARRPAAPGAKVTDAPTSTPNSKHWALDLGLIAAGLGILVFGSRLLVDHSIALAESFGVSEAVIGLTIVAAGTSMPELATSVIAALRKQPDIAIGSIIGSNVFNILGILGVASIVAPLEAPGVALRDMAWMVGFSLLLLPMLYTQRLLQRIEGGVLLALYGLYLFVLWPQ